MRFFGFCDKEKQIKEETYLCGSDECFFGDFSSDFLRSQSVGDFGAGLNGCGGISGTVIFHDGE